MLGQASYPFFAIERASLRRNVSHDGRWKPRVGDMSLIEPRPFPTCQIEAFDPDSER